MAKPDIIVGEQATTVEGRLDLRRDSGDSATVRIEPTDPGRIQLGGDSLGSRRVILRGDGILELGSNGADGEITLRPDVGGEPNLRLRAATAPDDNNDNLITTIDGGGVALYDDDGFLSLLVKDRSVHVPGGEVQSIVDLDGVEFTPDGPEISPGPTDIDDPSVERDGDGPPSG